MSTKYSTAILTNYAIKIVIPQTVWNADIFFPFTITNHLHYRLYIQMNF